MEKGCQSHPLSKSCNYFPAPPDWRTFIVFHGKKFLKNPDHLRVYDEPPPGSCWVNADKGHGTMLLPSKFVIEQEYKDI